MLSAIFVGVLALLAYLWYSYRRDALRYWQKRGFPTLPNSNFIFGDTGHPVLGRKSFIEFYRDAHFEFKKQGQKVGGIYWFSTPMLMLIDTDIIKKVLQTDFDAFFARGILPDPINNPLSKHIFNLDGSTWAMLRRKMTPAFSSGKIKMMFPIMEKRIDVLINVTQKICDNGNADLDYFRWLDKSGIDIIGQVAFGIDFDTLVDGDSIFFEMAQRIMRPKTWEALKLMCTGLSNPANIVLLLSSDKEMSDFFINLFTDAVKLRRKDKTKANDFMQLLIGLLDDEEETPGSGMTLLDLAAEAFIFFMAGYETTARTVGFTLYALVHHPHIQTKLRDEIQKELQRNNGCFNYDWIMNNEYLNMVIKEALRMYPPIMMINRMATRDYFLQDVNLTIPKDIPVIISSLGVHFDPDNYENPSKFIPERFSKENAQYLNSFANMAFGEGPRFCVGKRFAYLQTKCTLAKIVHHFEILPGTNLKYPLEISPMTRNMFYNPKEPHTFKMKPL